MKVLILSVHVKHRQSQYWRKLQPLFVSKTKADYEYGVVVNGDDPNLYKNVVHHFPTQTSHLQGIKVCLNLFRRHRKRFSHFLLLDSDCWPVRPDWAEIIEHLIKDSYSYAAPMRSENFDIFPHPSAFFMRSEFVNDANFGFDQTLNLLGMPIADVGTAMPKNNNDKQLWYPLLKTNYVSPHPLYASIYGDLFYHHCAGSRGLGFRANSFDFYDHIFTKKSHKLIYTQITNELVQRPYRFIEELRGSKFRRIYS